MILSICVPTYNRGKKALVLAQQLHRLQELYPSDIEIVFSNNGSVNEVEEYKQIETMQSDSFIYFEYPENMYYVGNYNQVIRLSHGDFCLLISDEDRINEEKLGYYIDFLKQNTNIGMVRARTSIMYSDIQESQIFLAGQDAIKSYFLQGNYISGIIYNRRVLTNDVINRLEEEYKRDFSNRGYYYYPHLFVEAILLISRDFYQCSELLILEDEPTNDQEFNYKINIPAYSSIEERLSQMDGYLEFISKIQCSDGIKLRMVAICINKTIFLTCNMIEAYKLVGIDIIPQIAQFPVTMLEMIDSWQIPAAMNNREILLEMIVAYFD